MLLYLCSETARMRGLKQIRTAIITNSYLNCIVHKVYSVSVSKIFIQVSKIIGFLRKLKAMQLHLTQIIFVIQEFTRLKRNMRKN